MGTEGKNGYNPRIPGERIIVLDKERTLRMDFNALARFEKETGKNILEPETIRGLTATDYRAWAWACLYDNDTSLTVDQVGHLMSTSSAEVSDALLELYMGDATGPIDDKETLDAKLPLGSAG